MKHTRKLMNGLLAGAIALAMVSTLAAQTPVDSTAKVIAVKGGARYSTGNGVWQPLSAGTVLRPGSIIQVSSDPGSYVDVVIGEVSGDVATPVSLRPSIPSSYSAASYSPSAAQNALRIWENSALGIDKLTAMNSGSGLVTETQLDLKQGRVTGSVKKMSAASKYEIKIPNGVAGVRGTGFGLAAEGVLDVFSGSMVMATVGSGSGNVATQVVMSGQRYDARTGQIGPIPGSAQDEFQRAVAALRTLTGGVPTTFATDLTLNDVSPVR
jgi:hypothetical protein